jgi:hypothetical protein
MEASKPLARGLGPDRQQVLLIEYQEVCRSHAGITDFRAKLLAILPIASGAGVGLLVAPGNGELSSTEAALLVALGIFGLGIDAGQFGGRRERLSLRQVYSGRARRRREQLLKAGRFDKKPEDSDATPGTWNPDEAPPTATMQTRRRRGLDTPFVGAEAAGYVVYHAVAVAWLVVAAFGVANLG